MLPTKSKWRSCSASASRGRVSGGAPPTVQPRSTIGGLPLASPRASPRMPGRVRKNKFSNFNILLVFEKYTIDTFHLVMTCKNCPPRGAPPQLWTRGAAEVCVRSQFECCHLTFFSCAAGFFHVTAADFSHFGLGSSSKFIRHQCRSYRLE